MKAEIQRIRDYAMSLDDESYYTKETKRFIDEYLSIFGENVSVTGLQDHIRCYVNRLIIAIAEVKG